MSTRIEHRTTCTEQTKPRRGDLSTRIRRWGRRPLCASAILVLTAGSAEAQFLETFDERLWGVQGSFTPTWNSLEQFRNILGADSLQDMQGSEWSIGFARGRMSGGHFGVSMVRQRMKGGTVCFSDDCITVSDATRLQGIEGNWFLAPGSPFAGERVQVGANVGLGAGWYQGKVQTPDGEADAADWLSFQGGDSIPVLMFRVEFAVAVRVAQGLKVMGQSGYGLPGRRTFVINFAYFPLAGR